MRIERIGQSSFSDLLAISHDVVLVSSGYESRARELASRLTSSGAAIEQRIVWAFQEHADNDVRKANDDSLAHWGFKSHLMGEADSAGAARYFSEVVSGLPQGRVELLIDISSMTRSWYGGMISALMTMQRDSPIITRFAYIAAEFKDPPSEYPPNEILGPIQGFASHALPDKPTALVIGLGYDRDRALGLKDYLDPQMTLLFYADPGGDARYVERVASVNSELMAIVRQDYVFTYPLGDCVAAYKRLESACRGLLREWRLVLCSLGPKPFGLICFLLASYYEDISIWRVSAGVKADPVDHKPAGEPLIFEVEWSPGVPRRHGC